MIELASPWFLLLLPLPILIWTWLPKSQPRQHQALRVPFFAAIQPIIDAKQRRSSSKVKLLLPSLIWCLVILSLANPRWVGTPQAIKREGRNIMMAVDISGSMQINDMQLNGRPVTRLSVVKLAARDFVDKRQGDKLGLILFGSRAYLQTPLTFDRKTLLHMLDDASVGLAGQRTSIGDAVGLAIKRLQSVPKKSRVLILLTDGANNAGVLNPVQAAEMAKSDDIKIYTIGLGAEQMIMRNFFGQRAINPSADLDEESLKEIARLTGGKYFRATDTAELAKIYQTIDKLEPTKTDMQIYQPVIDYYYWPLGLAFLLLLCLLGQLTAWPPSVLLNKQKKSKPHDENVIGNEAGGSL